MDTDLLQALPPSALIKTTLDSYDKARVRLSAGPLSPNQANPINDAENVSRLGRDFRSDVLDFCKRMANNEFSAGRFEEAERLYDIALKAGSNDATVTINRAAALLKVDR
jgi:predicted Zn-dependent protease